MICAPDHKHGENTYCRVKHGCQCGDCRRAGAEYEYWRVAQHRRGRPLRVNAIGSIRRIRALQALGWTHEDLGIRAGRGRTWSAAVCRRKYVSRATAADVAAVYDALAMATPPAATDEQASLVRRARRHATAQGWPPPLAWDDDDIDNPDASPANWKEAA